MCIIIAKNGHDNEETDHDTNKQDMCHIPVYAFILISYWWLFCLHYQVFKVVILVLLKCCEDEVEHHLPIFSDPFTFFFLLLFIFFLKNMNGLQFYALAVKLLTFALWSETGLYVDRGISFSCCTWYFGLPASSICFLHKEFVTIIV